MAFYAQVPDGYRLGFMWITAPAKKPRLYFRIGHSWRSFVGCPYKTVVQSFLLQKTSELSPRWLRRATNLFRRTIGSISARGPASFYERCRAGQSSTKERASGTRPLPPIRISLRWLSDSEEVDQAQPRNLSKALPCFGWEVKGTLPCKILKSGPSRAVTANESRSAARYSQSFHKCGLSGRPPCACPSLQTLTNHREPPNGAGPLAVSFYKPPLSVE